MTKKEAKKNRKRRRKLVVAFIMILLLVATLGTATYAWFTANRTVTVSPITVNVSTSEGLQISTDASTWKTIVTNDDILGASWSGVKNQIPGATVGTTQSSSTLVPVSSAGEIDTTTGFMKMFKGTVQANSSTGTNILVAEQSIELSGTNTKQNGDFVVFDLFFQSSSQQQIYLTSNTAVTASGDDKGIKNAARVAFLDEGNVSYDDTNIADPVAAARGLKGATAPTMIWEPNADVHTSYGVQNASDVYQISVGQTGASTVAYRGVKTDIPQSAAVPLKYDSAYAQYFSTNAMSVTATPESGIPSNAYQGLMTLQPGITKVRIYMWIEGQDVDCEDHASGTSLTYALQFSIDSAQS